MSLVAYSVKGKHQGVTYLVALACRLQQGSKENWVVNRPGFRGGRFV